MRLLQVGGCCDHSFISSAIGPGSVVLDLGFYKGEFATWIAEHFGCSVYGAEPNPNLQNDFGRYKEIRILSCAVAGQSESVVLRSAPGKCSTILAGAFEPKD